MAASRKAPRVRWGRSAGDPASGQRAVPGPGHAYCTPEGRDKRVRSCGRPTAVGRRLGLAGAPRARPQGRELCSRASSGWFPAVAGTPRQPEPGPRTCVCAELRLSARGGGGHRRPFPGRVRRPALAGSWPLLALLGVREGRRAPALAPLPWESNPQITTLTVWHLHFALLICHRHKDRQPRALPHPSVFRG